MVGVTRQCALSAGVNLLAHMQVRFTGRNAGIPAISSRLTFAHRSAQTLPSKNETNKTKSSNGNAARGASGMPQFVRYRLNEDELAQARSAAVDYSDVGAIIQQFCDEGYKFSCSHDSYGGGTQVFLTPSANALANQGWTLTARAPDLINAVAVLTWKHYTLFAQDWPKDEVASGGSNWG